MLIQAKRDDNTAMLNIINRFEPKIKKSLYQTNKHTESRGFKTRFDC
ncbi:hypothetical protein [Paenibacillus sp. FSL R7-0331]